MEGGVELESVLRDNLNLCYSPDDKVDIKRRDFCLLYFGLPLDKTNPISELSSLHNATRDGAVIYPSISHIYVLNNDRSYSMIVTIRYDTSIIRIRSCSSYRIYGVKPYIVKNSVKNLNKWLYDISDKISKSGFRVLDTLNTTTIGSNPSESAQNLFNINEFVQPSAVIISTDSTVHSDMEPPILSCIDMPSIRSMITESNASASIPLDDTPSDETVYHTTPITNRLRKKKLNPKMSQSRRSVSKRSDDHTKSSDDDIERVSTIDYDRRMRRRPSSSRPSSSRDESSESYSEKSLSSNDNIRPYQFESVIRRKKNSADRSLYNKSMEQQSGFDDRLLLEYRRDMHTIIIGAPGLGKTSAAKFLLGYKCVVAESLYDLKEFDHNIHKGIIFENIDFSDIEYGDIFMLTYMGDRKLVIDNTEVFIPKNCKLIFTTSQEDYHIFPAMTRESFYKQFCVMYIEDRLYTSSSDDEDEGTCLKVFLRKK